MHGPRVVETDRVPEAPLVPVPRGTRFRVVTRNGKKVRLAIAPSGKVVEARRIRKKKK